MIEHLIFDFDGTVSDSYPLFVEMMHVFAKENGLEINCDDEELNRHLKKTVIDAFLWLGWDKKSTPKAFLARFHEFQAERYADFKVFPEALDLLEYAKSQGKKCYIYTHSGSVVNQIMEHMGIEHYFSFVLDGSHGFPAKPAPNALNYLAEKFALDPKQCMMIGDRPIDAHAGMNAGMIGCLWDNDGLFPDAAVDHLVANLSEIKKLI